MLKIFLVTGVMILFPLVASAETIYLKDGQVIKAQITKENDYSVQIMEGGFPKVFYKDLIEKIEPDNVEVEKEPPTPYELAGGKEPLTEEKRDLIFRLMEANGARESMNQIFSEIISKAPEKDRPKYQALFKVDEIIKQLVPIYAKYYTTQDLKELIGFYKSPLGQKHIKVTPSVMQESMIETVKYFQEKMPQEFKPPASPK